MAKRLPSRITAMTPGLARSMKCGITPLLPSLRSVIETGTQAAAFGNRVLDAAAGGFRQPQSVAGIAGRARREMFGAIGRVREHRLAPCDIMREAAAGQHDAAPGIDADQLAMAFDDRAAHRAVLDDQFVHRRGQPQRNLQVERRFGEAPASALPLVSVMPRPWRITSIACFDRRFAT